MVLGNMLYALQEYNLLFVRLGFVARGLVGFSSRARMWVVWGLWALHCPRCCLEDNYVESCRMLRRVSKNALEMPYKAA